MSDSLVNLASENRLSWGVSWINKAKRLKVVTDALLAGNTTFQGLLDKISAAFVAATSPKDNQINEALREVHNGLKRELTYLRGLKTGAGTSALSDTLITNLLTVNTGTTATDLRFLFSSLISDANFDKTREDFFTSGVGATSY